MESTTWYGLGVEVEVEVGVGGENREGAARSLESAASLGEVSEGEDEAELRPEESEEERFSSEEIGEKAEAGLEATVFWPPGGCCCCLEDAASRRDLSCSSWCACRRPP